MKLGLVVDGHWGFISELLSDWQSQYDTEVFSFRSVNFPVSEERINRWRLKHSLKQFLDRNDIVFFEWAGPLTVIATHLSITTPLVVRLHSWELFEFAPHIQWNAVDRIILVSKAMQERFNLFYPDHSHKTLVIPSGKSLDSFHPVSHKFAGNIAILCDLVPIKRVYDLILTLYELKKQGYTLNLHIGGKPGDGANNQRYYISMQRAVEKLALQKQVFFEGWIDDVPTWLQAMDIFISNSFWEGQQNALIEAMASGCYSLSHFWDGAEEILPPEYLYASDVELQQKIIEHCKRPDPEKLSHQNYLRSLVHEKFNVAAMELRFREMLQGVAGARAGQ